MNPEACEPIWDACSDPLRAMAQVLMTRKKMTMSRTTNESGLGDECRQKSEVSQAASVLLHCLELEPSVAEIAAASARILLRWQFALYEFGKLEQVVLRKL